MTKEIHPTAIISPSAQLGEGVSVGAYAIIGPNVKIGARTVIGPHVVLDGLTTIGDDCHIFQFASVGAPPQDLKFAGEPSTLVIGNRNTIRESVTIHRGTAHGNMTTVIGDNNLFMAYSHVAHDCVVGNNNVFANGATLAGHVTITDHVIVGGLVAIHQFSRVGEYAMLGGGAMVPNDIPPYCIAQGDRCHLRGINQIGLKRHGFSEDQIGDIKRAYRHLFFGAGRMAERIENFPADLAEGAHVRRLVDFVRSPSSRGIVLPEKRSED